MAHEINNSVGFLNSNPGSLPRYVANLLTLLAAYEQTEINLPVPALHVLKQVKQKVDIDFLREDVSSLFAHWALNRSTWPAYWSQFLPPNRWGRGLGWVRRWPMALLKNITAALRPAVSLV